MKKRVGSGPEQLPPFEQIGTPLPMVEKVLRLKGIALSHGGK